MFRIILPLLFLSVFAFAEPTVSFLAKETDNFDNLQEELKNLQNGIGQSNPALDELMEQANHIAEMNDRCGSISLTEVMDDDCGHLYAVELPQFEKRYQEITGEIRLGSMSMSNELEQRTQQIDACAEALGRISVSREELLTLSGDVDLEPLSHAGDFDASYNFRLHYDEDKLGLQTHLAELWLDKCHNVVLRKNEQEFAPLFVESIRKMNDSLKTHGSNLTFTLDNQHLEIIFDINKSLAGTYYLNGKKLFSINRLEPGRDYSHLIMNLSSKKIIQPIHSELTIDYFEGRITFNKKGSNLIGRWTWFETGEPILPYRQNNNNPKYGNMRYEYQEEKNIRSVNVNPHVNSYDNDEQIPANEFGKEQESSSISWKPIIISALFFAGGTYMGITYNNKAKEEYEKGEPTTQKEFNERYENAGNYQILRGIGYTIATIGFTCLFFNIMF